MQYYLMLKEKAVAILEISKFHVEVVRVDNQVANLFSDFDAWIRGRLEIADRNNISNLCKVGNIRDTEEYVKATNAISITDCFWIKAIDSKLNWNKVNAYDNSISTLLANAAIDGDSNIFGILSPRHIKTPSPQYNIDGSADKCVKRLNGSIYLYKSCGEVVSEMFTSRPYSEEICAVLCKKLGITYFVNYTVHEHTTDSGRIKPYAVSEIFTDSNKSLIDYCDSKYASRSLMEMCKFFRERGDAHNYNAICNMLLLDSITLNIDRHDSNYGFIYNPNTAIIEQVAPIFDNDCALGSTVSVQSGTINDNLNALKNKGPRTDFATFDEQAIAVMSKAKYLKLKSLGHINVKDNIPYKGMSDKRKEFIDYLINTRIKEIVQLTEQTWGIHG